MSQLVQADQQDVATDPEHGGVPITEMTASTFGMPATSAWPIFCDTVDALGGQGTPMSSIFTISATKP